MRFPIVVLAFFAVLACFAARGENAGWRTDGTGKYPQATPPTQWGADKNVVWKCPLASSSNASPVIVGDKIFICAEPDKLVCVGLADGKIQWEKANPYIDALSPEDAAKMKEEQGKAEALNKEINALQGEARKLRAQLKTTPDDKAAKDNLDANNKKVGETKAQLEPFAKYLPPRTHNVNGYSSPTPVSDGKSVYAIFGNGVCAAYELDGKRRWIKWIERPNEEWGFSTSPLLCGGKVLVHIQDVVALDAGTGEQLWRTKSPHGWGSPVLARIGDVDLAITHKGDCLRVSDGKIIGSKLVRLTYNAPVVQDGMVYFVDENMGAAYKLPAQAADAIQPQQVWTNKPSKERYYASPVVHDGLVYAIQQKGIFSVFDAATGSTLCEKPLELGGGTTYPSITLAGKYLYVSSDNGTTLVLEAGKEYKEAAKNTLGETMRSSPVFVGSRMYVRGYKNLYCIGQ